MSQDFPQLQIVSPEACLLRFSETINEATADQIIWAVQKLKKLAGIQDLVPSYTTILVNFDSTAISRNDLVAKLESILAESTRVDMSSQAQGKTLVIPVYYGEEVGPDLAEVAAHCKLSIADVIARHSMQTYRAYAVGFTPGYSFLGNTAKALHIPRKSSPRLKVPKGSVAIAENQTAVYPSVTPGGWRIIGRTPLEMIDWDSETLGIIATGDKVKFEAISKEEFLAQGGTLDGF